VCVSPQTKQNCQGTKASLFATQRQQERAHLIDAGLQGTREAAKKIQVDLFADLSTHSTEFALCVRHTWMFFNFSFILVLLYVLKR
jgi:hypothetical protein